VSSKISPKDRPERPTTKQLLVSRREAAHILGGVSTATIKRLEQAGLLHGKRLNSRSPTGQIFYLYDEVAGLAQAEETSDVDA
jgi:hypothetical protein